MFTSILKRNLRALCLICLFGAIIAGLVGCSSSVLEPIANNAVHPSASSSFKPPEVLSFQVNQSSFSASGLDLDIQAKIMNHNLFTVNIKVSGDQNSRGNGL